MHRALIICGVAGVLACGPIDQSGSSSVGTSDAGSVDAGTSDAGAVLDAGMTDGGSTGVGSVDAGPRPDAGAADAGVLASDGGVTAGGGGAADAGVAAAGPCDGVVPASLGAMQSAILDHRAGDVCWYFTSDGTGNVAGESHPGSQGDDFKGAWQIFAPGGAQRGTFAGVGADVNGQGEGFESTQRLSSGNSLVLFGADGRALRSTPLDQGGCRAFAFESSAGGSLVLDGCNGSMAATRFDAQGNAVVTIQLGRIPSAAGVIDARGQTLIVVSPGSAVGLKSSAAARWYDAQLAPVTPFFAAPEGTGNAMLRPLIGGGAALQVGGAWVGTSQSGVASFEAPPAWLAAHKHFDLQIVRGAKAYACVPRSGAAPHDALDLISASGASCGSLTFPTDGLSVGLDGTVIGTAGEGGCAMTWWSGLLK